MDQQHSGTSLNASLVDSFQRQAGGDERGRQGIEMGRAAFACVDFGAGAFEGRTPITFW